MNEPHIGSDVSQLAVWQKAKELVASLDEMCAGLGFGRDKEWLIFLVQQASGIVINSIEQGWSRPNVAEILLSMYDAQGAISMIAYYVDFLAGEGYLRQDRAEPLRDSTRELDELLTNLIDVLRQELQLQTKHVLKP